MRPRTEDRLNSNSIISTTNFYECTPCLEWTGYKNKHGYSRFSFQGKPHYVHRVAYELFKGKIPQGLQLDHLCRNHCCINPDHLEPVTPRENTLRGITPTAKNAIKTHCKRGHEFTEENMWLVNTPHGKGRVCKTCNRLRERELYKSQQKSLGKTVGSLNSKKTHCPEGHEYNKENTYIYSTGKRACKECQGVSSRYRYVQKYTKVLLNAEQVLI